MGPASRIPHTCLNPKTAKSGRDRLLMRFLSTNRRSSALRLNTRLHCRPPKRPVCWAQMADRGSHPQRCRAWHETFLEQRTLKARERPTSQHSGRLTQCKRSCVALLTISSGDQTRALAHVLSDIRHFQKGQKRELRFRFRHPLNSASPKAHWSSWACVSTGCITRCGGCRQRTTARSGTIAV